MKKNARVENCVDFFSFSWFYSKVTDKSPKVITFNGRVYFHQSDTSASLPFFYLQVFRTRAVSLTNSYHCTIKQKPAKINNLKIR